MQHVTDLLGEYYDGELSIRRREQVKAHVQECAACRQELARLEWLSSLLNDYALPDSLTRPEVFRAQVMLKLPRRKSSLASYGTWPWYAVPLSLGGALLFLQAAVILLLIVVTTLSWGGLEILASLRPAWWQWVQSQVVWSDLLVSSGLSLFNLVFQVSLYGFLFLLLVPYVGWVGVLLYKVQHRTPVVDRKESNNGSF